jgi:superfamily II DNA or RNA helicase
VRKIRLFVKSLLEHIDAFTPAELYLIFQQSGILKTEGKSKDFIRDVNRGKISQTDLENFVRGDQSTADDYLGGDDETDESNELPVGEDEEIGDTKPDDGSTDASLADEEDEGKIDKLPEVTAKAALKALDSDLLASLDTEAAEFLVASGKAKIWTHAYRDPATASAQAGEFGESEYAEQVREEFFREFEDATKLEIPDGYAFSVEGNRCEPNLMQRHVASQIAQCRRYGNWSGTGAGKTLSAILATRCVDASLTVICCPNAVVGNEKSGWMSEIKNVFPDSEVATKTFNPKWTGLSDHRYLVLNYEKFQQGNSEAKLKKFVEKHDVDFIVVDEIHYAKQRKSDDMSRRKRLVEAFISSVGESNPELCVLGMSATPVINNLQEGKSLIELVTSVEHHDLDVRSTVPNCMRLHQKLTTIGTRWKPNYAAKLEQKMIDVDCSGYLEEITELKKRNSTLALEKILTKARIPAILEQLEHGEPTLIYTYYVKDIDQMLKNAIVDAGYRVGFYTGESKEGLEKFKRGDLDVLIGSSAVGTGVDGLQHCCSKLVINSLPWTNAEYEQLLGRIWRQGQKKESVKIVIPTTFAMVNGERWSYCDTKLDRIRYKKSIADAAVDGAVPEGNLRSPAQAQKDVMVWLKRLEDGVMDTVTRRKIVVPLVGDADLTTKRLAKYGDFSRMNNRWNQTHSENLAVRLQENSEEWEQYHTLYREARKTWEFVPVDDMIAWCKEREGYVIADFGCGEALLAKAVGDRHKVFSFDHIAIDDSVIEGDMADTALDSDSIDVAVFCLSLMGQNVVDYIREAHLALKIDGNLHIYEATSRFKNVEGFKSSLEKLGFSLHLAEERDKFTYIHAIKTPNSPQDSVELTL